jgi:gas vesicle protein
MKAFLIGLGLGVGLGVLFAPMSGEKTRNTLQDRAQGLAGSARETYKQGRDRVLRTVSSIRSEKTRPTGTETGA